MDLIEYERAKFELAAILRSAEDSLRERQPDVQGPFRDLFSRLAEDRFNLVVVGRFSRGKTSLMNALLETERLPMGLVPLTSVITTVAYGSTERAFIEHEGWAMPAEITLDEIPDYVTQQRNPGNQRRVTVARIELPAELLRRGFHFVDTPGLGSSIIENTMTTERFLPQADAFVLITSYDSPLSEEELSVLKRIACSSHPVFLVLNKHDTVAPAERAEVLDHVRDQVRSVFGDAAPRIFSISARDAIDANKRRDPQQFADSGVAGLREEIVRFLLAEKRTEFLVRMCERVDEALHSVPDAAEHFERLHLLRQTIGRYHPVTALTIDGVEQFSSCWICARLGRRLYDFLCGYQYDIAVRPDVRATLAESGGLCAIHTWRYAKIAGARGTCIGFADVLDRLALRLRHISEDVPVDQQASAIRTLHPTSETCDLCRVQRRIERSLVSTLARSLHEAGAPAKAGLPGLCLAHLRLVIEEIGPDDLATALITNEARILERVSGDLRRYVLKRDGVRRSLATTEERDADQRALTLLSGQRDVNVA